MLNRKFLFCLLILFGIAVRVASFSFNQYIHGDVLQYSAAAESLAARGDFLIDSRTDYPHFYSLKDHGGRFLEHNPLWALWGSVVVAVGSTSGFTALKILSLTSGIVLLFLIFQWAKKLGGSNVAWFALLLSSISYPLIDFSGNGSFYIFQAALYILFLLALQKLENPKSAWVIGILLGLGLLLNQQTIILWPVYVIICGRERGWRSPEVWRYGGIAIFCAAIFVAPWVLRNAILFGTPIIPADAAYVWGKLGVATTISDGVIVHHIDAGVLWRLFERSVFFWLPHNLYFINRKLFLLAPLSYIFFLLLVTEARAKKLLPAFLIIVFHVLLSSLWPIAKFRYIVPILPIVFALSGYYLWHVVQKHTTRVIGASASVILLGVVSLLTFWGTPSHTYYYDGILTTDNFGKQGELEFIHNQSSNPEL